MALASGLATVQWREGKQDLIGIITLEEAETLRRAVQVNARNLKIEVPGCFYSVFVHWCRRTIRAD